MNQELTPLIQAADLLKLYRKEKIVLFDASNSKDSKQNYLEKHLDGAFYIDLNTQLADIKEDAALGGRHPLPTPQQFAETLSEFGVTKNSHIVVYDDKNASNAAARLWWMLKSIGHEKVQVLDGGFQAALELGFPTTNEKAIPEEAEAYTAEKWILPTVDIHLVDQASLNEDFLIIDVRDAERYRGEKEPIDLIAGHIPGAVNVPFTGNLNPEGKYLSPSELKTNYSGVLQGKKTENIIVHCGSGVTACHTLLALASAGFEVPSLYVGSWSEWSRNDRPIEKTPNE